MHNDRNIELFLQQKDTLDKFLSRGAISQAQYDKSFGDLVKKIGMEEVVKETAEKTGTGISLSDFCNNSKEE